MTTYLFIAGHGELYSGFDPGAVGFVTMGEHRYFEDLIFPKMKKYIPKGAKVVLFSDFNVYDRQNLVSLASKYGGDTVVVECHLDAAESTSVSGGHVIIADGLAPDKTDIALRDFIAGLTGIRKIYNYRGNPGISGRSDLQNVRLALHGDVNYRLIELGFVTNRYDADILLNKTEEIAKGLVEAVLGGSTPLPKVDALVAADKALQPYKGNDGSWKALSVGSTVTIRDGASRWLNKNFRQMEPMSKDYDGVKDEVVEVKDVQIGYSNKAYRLQKLKVWILEQDLEEPRKKLYRTQTGAFGNKDNAIAQAEKMRKDGYDVHIVEN